MVGKVRLVSRGESPRPSSAKKPGTLLWKKKRHRKGCDGNNAKLTREKSEGHHASTRGGVTRARVNPRARTSTLHPRIAIDNRCEDGRFPVSASWVTISNHESLSSSETGIQSWKKHLTDWARCQKAIGGIYFPKKWRAETPWRAVSSNASPGWTVRFWEGMMKVF